METATNRTFSARQKESASPVPIKITLYELVEAISDELQPGEDGLVTQVVMHMLATGNIKSIGGGRKLRVNASLQPHY
jgi:hypothetical protein